LQSMLWPPSECGRMVNKIDAGGTT